MKVRMLVCMAGVNEVRDAGAVVELDDAEAASLVAVGYAEIVEEPKKKAAK